MIIRKTPAKRSRLSVHFSSEELDLMLSDGRDFANMMIEMRIKIRKMQEDGRL